MKNVVFLILGFLISAVLLSSCNKSNSKVQNEQTSGLNYKVSEVLNKNLIEKFKSTSDLQTLKSSSNISFDDSHIYKITVDNETNYSLLMVMQRGYNESNTKNYGFFVVMTNSDTTLYNSFIAETEKLGKDEYQINYFNGKQKPILSIVINSLNKTVQIINKKSAMATTDCGQATADCIGDVYTNHGWASVSAWVVSAFVPATVAVFAADCAAHNCL